MKKKKKMKKLIATLLVLVVLVGGYVALVKLMPAEEEETTEEEKIEVVKLEEDSIVELSYTQGEDEIVLEQKDDDTWYSPTDTTCPVNEYTVGNMTGVLEEVTASREIEADLVDEEAFGLSKPSKVISFTQADGTAYTYTLGCLNDVTDKYYFRLNDEKQVYMIDTTLYNTFDCDLLSLAEVEDYPSMSNGDISDFTLTYKGDTKYFVDSEDAAHKKNESEIPECVWTSGTDKSKLKEMDADTADELVQAIISLTNSECVSYNKTDAQLKKYGLDDPAMTLTVNYVYVDDTDEEDTDGEDTDTTEDTAEENTETTYLDGTFTVHFGNTDKDSGEYYVYMEGSNSIYTMNISNVDTLMSVFE